MNIMSTPKQLALLKIMTYSAYLPIVLYQKTSKEIVDCH